MNQEREERLRRGRNVEKMLCFSSGMKPTTLLAMCLNITQ